MKVITTKREMCRSPDIVLTVSSSAWRYLDSRMDAEQDYLVLSLVEDNWLVSIKPRRVARCPTDALKTQLGDYTMIVSHAADFKKLHGYKLDHDAGMLSVV